METPIFPFFYDTDIVVRQVICSSAAGDFHGFTDFDADLILVIAGKVTIAVDDFVS